MERKWEFVVDNMDHIRKYCRAWAGDKLDLDDLVQDTILDLLRTVDWYDSDRGNERQFVWLRVRKVSDMAFRKLHRAKFVPLLDRASQPRVEQKVLLRQCIAAATPKERSAIWAYAIGLRGNEVKDAIGVTPQARAMRVRGLANRLEGR